MYAWRAHDQIYCPVMLPCLWLTNKVQNCETFKKFDKIDNIQRSWNYFIYLWFFCAKFLLKILIVYILFISPTYVKLSDLVRILYIKSLFVFGCCLQTQGRVKCFMLILLDSWYIKNKILLIQSKWHFVITTNKMAPQSIITPLSSFLSEEICLGFSSRI